VRAAVGKLPSRNICFVLRRCGLPLEVRGSMPWRRRLLVSLLLGSGTLLLTTAVALHAQSPAAIAIVIDAVEAAQRDRPRVDMRHAIEHSGLATDDQIARMARAGMVPDQRADHSGASRLLSLFWR